MTKLHLYNMALFILSVFVWWLSGYDFNERNPLTAMMFVCNAIILFMINTGIKDSYKDCSKKIWGKKGNKNE